MIKVLIADDEPFIPLGLSKLINWEQEGFQVVFIASNGKEAYEYIENNPVDLVITDIQMPEMNGLELLEKTHGKYPNIQFVVLSGFNDFNYVQTALRNKCRDYLLKPIQKEELLRILHEINNENIKKKDDLEKQSKMQAAYIERAVINLLHGKENEEELKDLLSSYPALAECKELRYIHLCPADIVNLEEIDDSEINDRLTNLFSKCKELVKADSDLVILDYNKGENDYTVGFIFDLDNHLLKNEDETTFYERFVSEIQPCVASPLILIAGKIVNDIKRISISYSSANMLRSFQGFLDSKNVYIYEEEMSSVEKDGAVLCTESLDNIVNAISINDKKKINENVDLFFEEIGGVDFSKGSLSINMNYLLFRLIYLAVQQDPSVNQEEVMRYIGESSFEKGFSRGSKVHLLKFVNEYSEYLIQLRSNVSRGVLSDIEREIKDNYASNLTLRELSQKYYVNNSYLGQVFRKKYGVSFKDYLCDYRIDKAAEALIGTDKKITIIAEEVGYKDIDYFTTKFIEKKGMPPAKYRREMTKV